MKRKFFDKEYDLLDLRESGINDLIFDLIPAIEFMHDLIRHNIRILGGDIIIKNKSGNYDVSTDNWYSQSKVPEETFVCAMDYLKKYIQSHPNANWKIAVVTSEYL